MKLISKMALPIKAGSAICHLWESFTYMDF